MTKPAAPVTTLDKLGGQAEAHVGNYLYVCLAPALLKPLAESEAVWSMTANRPSVSCSAAAKVIARINVNKPGRQHCRRLFGSSPRC